VPYYLIGAGAALAHVWWASQFFRARRSTHATSR
jgi:hypothetical protein